jgi:hypothetical protein
MVQKRRLRIDAAGRADTVLCRSVAAILDDSAEWLSPLDRVTVASRTASGRSMLAA